VLSEQLKARIEAATVTVTNKGGRGVLVDVGANTKFGLNLLVLTAAHCIDWKCDGEMALRDFFLEEIESRTGKFRLAPEAVEPVSDVAALMTPDGQEPDFQEDLVAFEEFCEKTAPLHLCTDDLKLFQPFPVFIYTHEHKWVGGTGRLARENAPSLWVEFDGPIKRGTSGSAIVNEAGEIVALVSISGGRAINGDVDNIENSSGPQPRPHLALPVWLTNGKAN
jgi:hypothetical protein